MKYKRVILVGDFPGIPILKKYIPEENIAALITASNRPQYHEGLFEIAKQIGCPGLVQPARKESTYQDFYNAVKALEPDLLICNSYSMKIQSDIIELVNGNAFNIHGAYLPQNRGSNPENWALIKGEEFIGVTLHYMSSDIDAGDIVYREKIAIHDTDTWLDLNQKMVVLSERIICEYSDKLMRGDFTSFPQEVHLATINKRLNEDYPEIKFDTMNDREIYNLIRAQVAPLKGAYIKLPDGSRKHFDAILSLDKIAALRQEFK